MILFRIITPIVAAFALMGSVANGQQADHVYVCKIAEICEGSRTCMPSSRSFELQVNGNGSATTAPLRGSVRLSETEWRTIAPFWLVRQVNFDKIEMLHFSLDETFVRFTAAQTAPMPRFSDEDIKKGGPIQLRDAETTKMTGTCE